MQVTDAAFMQHNKLQRVNFLYTSQISIFLLVGMQYVYLKLLIFL